MDRIDLYIRYIVLVAQGHGMKLVPIRLIKFIYLADYYSMKELNERITNWKWLFWDYGPFCIPVMDAIKGAVDRRIIFSNSQPSKFNENADYVLFDSGSDPRDTQVELAKIEKQIPLKVRMYLDSTIKKYGNDTVALLNFAYFKTEPMMEAKPREQLELRYGPTVAVVVPQTEVSARKMKKAREALLALRTEYESKLTKPTPISLDDKVYAMGMTELFPEDEFEISETFAGYASIEKLGS